MPQREYPPAYSIRIESAVTGMARIPTITHIGALAPLIAALLERHPEAKERVEAADARTHKLDRKPRGVDPVPEPDEFGGL